MYGLYVDTSSVNPQGSHNRDGGFSIRCILKSDAEIISETETMQSVTNDQLATIMPSEGSTASLRDARDDQVYTLAKINGNYWMTQNLRFTGTSLDPATTNIDTNKTISYGGLTAGDSYDEPRILDSGNTTYGVYYNYAAASAGTITGVSNSNTQTYDVCPKGWRLPTESEFSGITSYSSAFSPVKSGNYSSGSRYDAGSKGCWWSATPHPNYSSIRYFLYYDGSSLSTSNSGRIVGYSVRCIRSS